MTYFSKCEGQGSFSKSIIKSLVIDWLKKSTCELVFTSASGCSVSNGLDRERSGRVLVSRSRDCRFELHQCH